MVTQINPKPNTFYRVKALDDDIGIYPVYGDAYVGMGANYDIRSSPDSTYYLAESTVITENDILQFYNLSFEDWESESRFIEHDFRFETYQEARAHY